MQSPSLALVLISNGPGELATWVRPIAEKLHKKILMRPRAPCSSIDLRLVLVPCPNATGKEANVAKHWGQFAQITPAKTFWNLLVRPQIYGHWPKKGLVVFLGGDQFWSVLLSARLGYRHMTYAEWIVRWPQWNDRIAVMSAKVLETVPKRYKSRCKVVGDLMADLPRQAKANTPLPQGRWIALMPGSKKAKLSVGVPFMLETADRIKQLLPNCQFLLPLAPTTTINELNHYTSFKNPIARNYHSKIVKIESRNEQEPLSILTTNADTRIHLHEGHPAYNYLSQCDLALTTIGANTAELGGLNVPMIVIVPTQHIDVMQAWDGMIGLIARLPGLKWCIGFLINNWWLRKHGFLAWPNITAGRMIVPEKIGKIYPSQIANEVADWMLATKRLKGQKKDLQSLRGKPGAINSICEEIIKLLEKL